MSEISLVQLQYALFFDSIENRPDKLIPRVDDALDGVFDQMPTILPIPQDAPPEVPSVIMQSSNGVYTCNIARTRIDFIVNYGNSGQSVSVNVDDFIKQIRIFSNSVSKYKKFTRFGFVGKYFLKDNNPSRKIQNKYFKKDLGDLEELNFRFNKRFESNELTLNDVVEISKGTINEVGRTSQQGVFIQRDMNNVPVSTSLATEEILKVITSHQNSFTISGISELI
ncbi:hypothetical protein ABC255_09670 [Neobacillus sp. 3P2-tot-E-2]|uniref:hypothetical protein n=1 Tax=Neobacillus sp. 3P2-tot-E-2 TaxID=3132212 RepID=UPI0039A058EB